MEFNQSIFCYLNNDAISLLNFSFFIFYLNAKHSYNALFQMINHLGVGDEM